VAQACSYPISLALNVEATLVREGHVPPDPVAGSLPRPVAGFTPDRAAGFTLGQVVGSIADRAGVCTRGPEVVCTLVPEGACTRDRAEATTNTKVKIKFRFAAELENILSSAAGRPRRWSTQDHLEGKAPIVVRGVPASRASWDPSGLKGIAHPDCHFLDHRRAETITGPQHHRAAPRSGSAATAPMRRSDRPPRQVIWLRQRAVIADERQDTRARHQRPARSNRRLSGRRAPRPPCRQLPVVAVRLEFHAH
jgi:hypothetical protein